MDHGPSYHHFDSTETGIHKPCSADEPGLYASTSSRPVSVDTTSSSDSSTATTDSDSVCTVDACPPDTLGTPSDDIEVESDTSYRNCPCCCGDLAGKCRAKVNGLREFADELVDLCRQLDIKKRVRNVFTVETLKRKVPIIKWLPKYRPRDLQGDFVAGVTVGLTVIPQSIAYAQIAGLDSQFGLYSSFMGCFIYALLGTAKDVSIGPVAIMSLLVATFARSPVAGDATYAIVVSLIGGIIQTAMGIFCLGFVIEYISHPVINSFTTASAITIMESQFKKWLGLKKIPQGFLRELTTTLARLAETRLWDFLLGAVCLVLLHILKLVKDVQLKNSDTSRPKRVIQYIIWLAGTARNAVVVLLAGAAAAIFLEFDMKPFSATNNMPPGLPQFHPPRLHLDVPAENRTVDASEIFESVGAGFGIIPILGVLESIAVSKAFAKRNGYRIDADQELIALGIGNILGSFVSAYPVTGSFSRTAVNSQSGVRTPLGGLFTGLLVILSLLFLTPYFNFIPDAALAAIIIAAVFDLIDFSLLPKLWRIKKVEVFPWLLTFILSLLLGVEYGIIIGIGVTLLMLLYPWGRPSLTKISSEAIVQANDETQVSGRQVALFQINHGLLFPGTEHLNDTIFTKCDDGSNVILDFSHVANIDYTVVEGFDHILSELSKSEMTLVVLNLQPYILEAFENARVKHLHHTSSVEDAIRLIREIHEQRQQRLQQQQQTASGEVNEAVQDADCSCRVDDEPRIGVTVDTQSRA